MSEVDRGKGFQEDEDVHSFPLMQSENKSIFIVKHFTNLIQIQMNPFFNIQNIRKSNASNFLTYLTEQFLR